jgi:hypothetical protein
MTALLPYQAGDVSRLETDQDISIETPRISSRFISFK